MFRQLGHHRKPMFSRRNVLSISTALSVTSLAQLYRASSKAGATLGRNAGCMHPACRPHAGCVQVAGTCTQPAAACNILHTVVCMLQAVCMQDVLRSYAACIPSKAGCTPSYAACVPSYWHKMQVVDALKTTVDALLEVYSPMLN